MKLVDLRPMRLFKVSDELPHYLKKFGNYLYDLEPFPSNFPAHFNDEFREDAVYQKLDELTKHLYGANGRYCEHRDDDCLDVVDDPLKGSMCFIPIGDDKYRKILNMSLINCEYECNIVIYIIGNQDFLKHIWVVAAYMPFTKMTYEPSQKSNIIEKVVAKPRIKGVLKKSLTPQATD